MGDIINLIYLIAAICFILALQGLSSPKSAVKGSLIGIVGMVLSLGAVFAEEAILNHVPIMIAIALGGFVGAVIARRIQMTSMPQLVAGFHSLVGLAAVLIACSALLSPEVLGIGARGQLSCASLFEMSLGASIGAITFTGSVIAFAKLQGVMSAASIKFRGQQYAALLNLIAVGVLIYYFTQTESILYFVALIFLSGLLGGLLIIPVGGADMPVIVSMLNSYSGWAAAGIGFTLQNSLLIITGALVGSSGAILSYVMCKGMNRSLWNVVFGAFKSVPKSTGKASGGEDKVVQNSSPVDAAFMMNNSSSVIIVPGYGMAVAQAQHALKELVDTLSSAGVKVRFAIHPVAGRMPGHMNVLLAEAGIDYEQVFELEEINSDMPQTEIVLVVGANDVTNPAARDDKTSPIYGMPIVDVDKAQRVLFIKRSMATGYAGIENELFYNGKTMMLFGDAKKVLESITREMSDL